MAVRKVKGTCVPVEYLVVGMLENNVYIIGNQDAVMVVDPTAEADAIVQAVGDRKLEAIVLTHRHFDHMGGAKALRDKTGAPVIASAIDAPYICGDKELANETRTFTPCPIDRTVNDGDKIKIGDAAWRVLVTPGHTKGGICLFLDSEFTKNPGASAVLVSGDTLFCGTIGRTDFEGGDRGEMCHSLKRLAALPDDTVVLPGHNDLTSISAERHRVFELYC